MIVVHPGFGDATTPVVQPATVPVAPAQVQRTNTTLREVMRLPLRAASAIGMDNAAAIVVVGLLGIGAWLVYRGVKS